ncbi:BTB/POZ domain-containing protein 9-like [Contarinia nasturtii]|uniref:BTB/POZ domain-containing protein 9-like n=1 Tax=Contarinia nasturtii TaxID=265458 RepID=UPI0012D3817C|nr:BTB/POZ domain-containing protein 9-like [Contarinia nasturtii]
MYLPKYNVELIDGFMKPKFNVAKFRFDFGITVIEGGGGNNMLNDNLEDFTCHIKNCGCIMLLFNQPYQIDSIRMLLGNDKNNYNKYSFFIETSIDKENWEMAIDKRSESLSGWQMFQFEPRPASFIKITGTQNENDFICTYFECPCDPNVPIIMLKTSSFQTKN